MGKIAKREATFDDQQYPDRRPEKDPALSNNSDRDPDTSTESERLGNELRAGLVHPDKKGDELEHYRDQAADRFEKESRQKLGRRFANAA